MGRRKNGSPATQDDFDLILRWVIPATLLLFALNALRFAFGPPSVTDVAHLKVVSLSIGRLVAWIAGISDILPPPTPLRTIPLPLLVDWLIWRINPAGLAGLRIAHILITTLGFWLLLRAIAMRLNLRAAAMAGLIIALSPRLVDAAVSLGPNPFVLALFCWQFAILLTRGKIGGPVPLMLFVAVGAAAGLCGMIGIIASASLFAAMIASATDWPDARRRILATLLVLPAWASPLAFTVLAGRIADPFSMQGLVWLITKILAHNADMIWLPAGIALIGGTAILVLLALGNYAGRISRNGFAERNHSFALALVAATTGSILIVIAGPLLGYYVWTDQAAHAWLSLLIILLAAAAFGPRLVATKGAPHYLRLIAGMIVIIGALSGTIALQARSDWFVAGPEDHLAKVMDTAGKNSAIVYFGNNWGRIYFPHARLSPIDNEQWILALDGKSVMHVGPDAQLGDPQPLTVLKRYNALVIARIDRRSWREMNAVRDPAIIRAAPPAPLLGFPNYWLPEPAQAAPGEYWLTTQLLRRFKGA